MQPENESIAAEATPDETPSLIAGAAATPPETPPVEPAPGETPPEEAEKTPEFIFKDEDFKAPEGFEIDPDAKAEFIALANEHKITPAAAEALVGLQAKLAKAGVEAQTAAWTELQTKWRGEVKADPDIGGDKLDGVLSNVAKLVDKYGSEELRQVMTLTGAGNNVHVVNFLNKLAKDLVEAPPVVGAPVSAPQSLADSLFTTMKKG